MKRKLAALCAALICLAGFAAAEESMEPVSALTITGGMPYEHVLAYQAQYPGAAVEFAEVLSAEEIAQRMVSSFRQRMEPSNSQCSALVATVLPACMVHTLITQTSKGSTSRLTNSWMPLYNFTPAASASTPQWGDATCTARPSREILKATEVALVTPEQQETT